MPQVFQHDGWDETLFAGAAPYYDRGRYPYPPGLAAAFARGLSLSGTERLLDVGCGPGSVTLRVARVFATVVGLDPDAGMLAEARRLAAERGIGNATFVQRPAEDLPAGLGPFEVVSFAGSFHWMDRPRVAAAVRSMLTPGGAVVQVDTHPVQLRSDAPNPAPPTQAIGQLVRHYLGPDRRAGRVSVAGFPDDEEAIWPAAGFSARESVPVPDGRLAERDIDDVVAATFSMSYAAPRLFGDRLAAFENELRDLLAKSSASGRFSVRIPDAELKIWRPSA